MSTKVYINGQYFDKADAKVSVYDHGFLYGDGVFEGIRVYNGKVFEHRRHVERLYDSAKHIAMEIPMSLGDMMASVEDAVRTNNKTDGYIRLIVSRGPGTLGLDPRKCQPQVIIIVDDIALYPKELYDAGLKVITSSYIRSHPHSLDPRIKSLNYLNNILAKIEAIRAGCLEAIMMNHDGEIAECTGDNVFVLKRGVLKTPPATAGALEGITREVILRIAKEQGVTTAEVPMSRHDVYTAEEMFLTGTAAEVIGVVEVDGRVLGDGKPGPLTRQMRELFMAYARS